MNENWPKDIRDRVKGIPSSSGHSNKMGKVSFDDLVFVPAQLNKRPVDYYREKIDSKTVVGKLSKKPIELETPIVIGAMSFGALSREAKTALAKASSLAGTIENTGEGGLLPEEREFSDKLIIQYSSGRFGITEEILKKADAVELKIGQGAKGGMGGFLPGHKVTKEIAEIRKLKAGDDVHSSPYHSDILSVDDLKKKVDWLRELTGGVPIIIKLAAGDIENDLKMALQADPDVIAIDGLEGGTGASPAVSLEEIGVPSLAALVRARKVMGDKKELWIGGGLVKGGDFAKALALGADVVFVATPLLVAMGCIYCRSCYLGKCPKGVATQDPELRKKLNIKEAAQNVSNYIKNCTEEIKMITGACGEDDIHKLNKDHLRALNTEISRITGLKTVSEG